MGNHVADLLTTIDAWGETGVRRSDLRFIALVHDSFKYAVSALRPKTGENHHAMRARRFAEDYTGEERLLAAIERRIPGAPVLATSGLLARDPARPIPVAPATVQTYTPIRSPAALGPEGRRILHHLRKTEGPAVARPEALYGYEAMRLVLDAIRRAGPDRRGVIRRSLTSRTRRSALGDYTVRATGDIDAGQFALWALRHGRFEYQRIIGKAR